MQCMGLSPTASEIARMIDEVDADGSGVIDFSEFVTLMARKVNNADKDEEIRAAFDIFDKDKSGKITCVELRAIMRALGDHLTDTEVRACNAHGLCSVTDVAQIDRMIREADSNGDGEIGAFSRLLSSAWRPTDKSRRVCGV